MSAIVGVFNLDNSPVQRADIERMVDSLAHRGQDGAAVWNEESVGPWPSHVMDDAGIVARSTALY
jgi:asparagine synthetase B (glutamine-hydrolysing)